MNITFKIYSTNNDFYVKMTVPYSLNNLLGLRKLNRVRNIRVK